MAYTVENVRKKKHEEFFEARHSGGYFDRVWGVHPLADVAGQEGREVKFIRFSRDQLVIEGRAEVFPLPRFLLPFNFLASQIWLIHRLVRLIRKRAISMIMATDNYYSGLFGLALSRVTGKPLAVGIFGNPDELYEATGALMMPRLFRYRRVEQLVARIVLSNADLVFAANRNNLRFGVLNGARQRTAILPNSKFMEPVHLVEPTLRPSPETVLARLRVPSGKPLMLYLGRLLPLKHPDDAVRAMARVIEHRPDAIGLLAGAGAMRSELENLVEELGMTDRIRLVGLLDHNDLYRLIPHVITLSPLTGLALIECGLGGSPIVAYDRDWQAEFVDDGKSGFVVPFRNHGAMAARTLELVENPSLAAKFSQAIRTRALEFTDKQRLFDFEHKVFESLLTNGPVPLVETIEPPRRP
jgi:glycosyltransferase involved in cell wall biosynthesis